jgi:hypothetical protein
MRNMEKGTKMQRNFDWKNLLAITELLPASSLGSFPVSSGKQTAHSVLNLGAHALFRKKVLEEGW